jgi:hypothetical protein
MIIWRYLAIPFIFLWHIQKNCLCHNFFCFVFICSKPSVNVSNVAFVLFTFKLLQVFITSYVPQFVKFLSNLWVHKIDCVFSYFFASKVFFSFVMFLVFTKFHVLTSIVTCMIVIVLQVVQHSEGLGVFFSFHFFVSIF